MTDPPTVIHDPGEVERLLRRDTSRHLLALGDLDPYHWERSTYYHGHGQILLVYRALAIPVVLAHADEPQESMENLVEACLPLLPCRFYAQVSRSAVTAFQRAYELEHLGTFYQMSLLSLAAASHTGMVEHLTERHTAELVDFYSRIPYAMEARFEPAMLKAGPYLGIRVDGTLASVAGTLVVSKKTRVAVLGNIATHPDHRRKGLANSVTSALCKELSSAANEIGLNVGSDNGPAIALYEKLGFQIVGEFEGYSATARM